MSLREGDKVVVIAGKDKSPKDKMRESRVIRVLPRQGKVIVEGVNTAKRHQRAAGQTMQAGIIDKDMPIDISNVMLICDDDGPVRTGTGIDAGGKRYRRCVKCDKEI